MKSSFCPLSKKKDKIHFQIIEKLNIDDLVWLKARDEKKASYLQYLHRSYPDKFKLIKMHDKDNTLLVFPLEIIHINLSELYQEKAGIIGSISKKLLSFCKFNIAHPTYSLLYDFDFSIADDRLINATDKHDLIIKGIEKISKELNINIVTIPTGSELNKYSEKLFKKEGYERPLEDFTMEMQVDAEWKCFEDYIAALKRKYSKRAVTIRKKGKDLTLKTLSLADIKAQEVHIYELYKQVVSKQKFLAGTAPQDHFTALKEAFGEDFVFEAQYDAEGNMLAFLTYFRSETILNIHYVGLDYAKNDALDLYFNLLFRAVEIGIKEQKCAINLGRTSLDAKASLGANPKMHYTYVKTNGLSKIVKRCAAHQVAKLENNSWKIRKPFKADVSVLEEA